MFDHITMILILIAQITIIVILLKRIDNPDLSQEDATVKNATSGIDEAKRHLPPQNK